MLGTDSLPRMCESFTETGTWCALRGTVFSSCLLYLDYFDSKRAHTVTHPRLCMLPLLSQGNGGLNRQDLWPAGWWTECMGGKNELRAELEGKKSEEEHKDSSRGSSVLESTCLERLHPAHHFPSSDPISLNTHSASFSSSLSPVPTRPHFTQLQVWIPRSFIQ